MDRMTAREIAEEIAGEGSYTLPNGDVVRFRQEPDEWITVSDFPDCYGQTEWVRMGFSTRPANMDGCAEIIDRDRGSVLWWQPPTTDKATRRQWHTDKDYQRTLREMVLDCHRYGFRVYIVELCRGEDAYGRPVVVAVDSLGGIEPFTRDADTVEIVADLITEVLRDAEAAA